LIRALAVLVLLASSAVALFLTYAAFAFERSGGGVLLLFVLPAALLAWLSWLMFRMLGEVAPFGRGRPTETLEGVDVARHPRTDAQRKLRLLLRWMLTGRRPATERDRVDTPPAGPPSDRPRPPTPP
jgi:hypothetical protein